MFSVFLIYFPAPCSSSSPCESQTVTHNSNPGRVTLPKVGGKVWSSGPLLPWTNLKYLNKILMTKWFFNVINNARNVLGLFSISLELEVPIPGP